MTRALTVTVKQTQSRAVVPPTLFAIASAERYADELLSKKESWLSSANLDYVKRTNKIKCGHI